MITMQKYYLKEIFGMHKFYHQYMCEFNIYKITRYKLFGVLTVFKKRELVKTDSDTKWKKPKSKRRLKRRY